MKALLYTDLITIGKAFKQFLLSITLMCGILIFTSLSNEGVGAARTAEEIQNTIMLTGSLMIAFFALFQLFGQDEREGWESVKLSLPVTRREIVASRYLIMAIVLAALLAAGAVTGSAIAAIATHVKYGTAALVPGGDLSIAALLAFSAALVYLAIEMPLFFKMGISKARLFFAVPFLAFMLFMIKPVRDFIGELVEQVAGFVGTLDSPLPLVIGLLVFALVLYAVSLFVSTRLYATREF